MEWKLRALTDIWTGDAERKPDRLIPTGVTGSLRWWFEVLVRGLEGRACDPTVDEVRCPSKKVKGPHKPGNHCVVCELFGCTGWARKFRLMIMDENGGEVIQSQIEAGQTFTLKFIPLRKIQPEEWCLLDLTLRLIADYGAIGGKTVFKPSDEQGRENAFHHRDFGLVQYVQGPDGWQCDKTLEDIRDYVTKGHWREAPHSYRDNQGRTHDFSWASLQNFWCVKGRYLARLSTTESTFNLVVGRKQDKSIKERRGRRVIRWSDLLEDPRDEVSRWLAGRQQESKKVFSFKHPEEGGRTFGFVKPGLVDFGEIKRRLKSVWGNDFENNTPFQEGHHILVQLFQQEECG